VQAEIDGYGYLPELITIGVGGTIVWTNIDRTPHSATAYNAAFDTGVLLQGSSFAYTFTQPGEYNYFYTRHSAMTGSVIVTP
jgi:plastocyanin